jgi:hypothetical protein
MTGLWMIAMLCLSHIWLNICLLFCYLLSFILPFFRHKLDLDHYHQWHDGCIDGAGSPYPCGRMLHFILLQMRLNNTWQMLSVTWSICMNTILQYRLMYNERKKKIGQLTWKSKQVVGKRERERKWNLLRPSAMMCSNVLNFYFMVIGIGMNFFWCTVFKTELASHH